MTNHYHRFVEPPVTRRGWHFLPPHQTLRFHDYRKPQLGERLGFRKDDPDDEPQLCARGMHASSRITDAERYAPTPAEGCLLTYVEVEGVCEEDESKWVGSYRTILAGPIPFRKVLDLARPDDPDRPLTEADIAICAFCHRDYLAAATDKARELVLHGFLRLHPDPRLLPYLPGEEDLQRAFWRLVTPECSLPDRLTEELARFVPEEC